MKQITMSDAQYILSTHLILPPFNRVPVSKAMSICGYSFERLKAIKSF